MELISRQNPVQHETRHVTPNPSLVLLQPLRVNAAPNPRLVSEPDSDVTALRLASGNL